MGIIGRVYLKKMRFEKLNIIINKNGNDKNAIFIFIEIFLFFINKINPINEQKQVNKPSALGKLWNR
jgi:hypothetical protein